jgi:hypothetical protein
MEPSPERVAASGESQKPIKMSTAEAACDLFNVTKSQKTGISRSRYCYHRLISVNISNKQHGLV